VVESYNSPTRRRKTAEVVARRIVAYIAERQLEPGAALPQESEMQALLGVGRSTVREALRLLETQGVVALKTGRGPVLQRPTPEYLLNSLTLLLQFQGATFESLLRARLMFEPAVVAEAARVITGEEIDRLRQNLAGTDDEPEAFHQIVRRELEFHHLIAKAAHNPFAETIVVALNAALSGEVFEVVTRHDTREDLRFHRSITDALAAGDPDTASALMHEHLDDVLVMTTATHPDLLARPIHWM